MGFRVCVRIRRSKNLKVPGQKLDRQVLTQSLGEGSITGVVTLANGTANSGYIPNNASFGAYTFQVLSSRLQPGCAEGAIDNGLLDLIRADER
jgi:hypothetical protein